jgi:Arc/MetJ-type ribon-helix-helix transcriptional regulator
MTADPGIPRPEITLRLPESVLNTVLAHLYAGRYSDVADAIQCIALQATPQLATLAKIANAESIQPPSERTQ